MKYVFFTAIGVLLWAGTALATPFNVGGLVEVEAASQSKFNFGEVVIALNSNIKPDLSVDIELKPGETYDNVIDVAVITRGNWRVGRQTLPFGTFEVQTIADSFTREKEDISSVGIVYSRELSSAEYAVYLCSSSSELEDGFAAGAQVFLTPVRAVRLAFSGIVDQKNQDLSFSSSYHEGIYSLSSELFYGLAGMNRDSIILNLNASCQITPQWLLIARADRTNGQARNHAAAGELSSNQSRFILGASLDLGSGLSLAGEWSQMISGEGESRERLTTQVALEL